MPIRHHPSLRLMRKLLKKQEIAPEELVTDRLRAHGAAARELGLRRKPRGSSAPLHRSGARGSSGPAAPNPSTSREVGGVGVQRVGPADAYTTVRTIRRASLR